MHIDDLLKDAMSKRASDLHLDSGNSPVLRIDGELISQIELPVLAVEDVVELLSQAISEEQRKRFEEDFELDFAYTVPGIGRFRANACVERGSTSVCFRMLQGVVLDIEQLGLPDVVKDLALKEYGMVLVTGPTGSGKSTTLAAMINYLNSLRRRRVITIEDPIEFLYENDKCFITQREIGFDTKGFATALKYCLRQDPDVILVGEMRDLDTIATALTAAETGHLVLTTLHTPSCPQAIDRMIDVFPPHQQQQVRIQLSTVLLGVFYQTLVPRLDGPGRVPAVEIMLATDAISNLIREARTAQMWSTMQTGSQYGMQTIDQALMQLFNDNVISLDDALRRCREPEVARKSLARTAVQK